MLAIQKVKSLNYSQLGIRVFCRQNSSLSLPPAAGLLSPSPKRTLLLLPASPPTKLAVQPRQLAP